jgi:DNA-binding FadR family transcriptional regulator
MEPAPLVSPRSLEPSGEKLAARIAGDVERYIVDHDWPVGEVIFSEADLIERYGVSRTIVREAVRLLEQRTIARMRRGPGGGLVVCAPEPDAVTDVAAVYLEYQHVTPAQLFEARVALEVTAAGLAANRITASDVERLRDAVTREADHAADGDGPHPHDVHLAIAEAAKNPSLQLFVEVIAKLVDHRTPPEERALNADEVHHAHAKIVEAIVNGDAELAQRRMRRHLAAITPWINPRA